jgi:putative toxin-antitoxin system antitoxin component (TIGR02293 family)
MKVRVVLPGSGRTSGIIQHYIHHGQAGTGATPYSPQQVIEIVSKGLPFQELETLRSSLGLSLERLAPKIGLSKATLNRRRLVGRLGVAESDKAVRFARLLGQAVNVFEGEEAARDWLTRPQVGLGGAVPLDYADTEVGAREVERLLGRIEYGVYS